MSNTSYAFKRIHSNVNQNGLRTKDSKACSKDENTPLKKTEVSGGILTLLVDHQLREFMPDLRSQ